MRASSLVLLFALAATLPAQPTGARLSAASVSRFADLALSCIHREYPNKIGHVLQSDEDVHPPRELTPIFYGCFDWHSAVHGHWLLVRLCRMHPDASFTPVARKALALSFTDAKAKGELRYLEGKDRNSFERPYGLAWLLQLHAELHEWSREDASVKPWAKTIDPIARLAAKRFKAWFPKLSHPIRTGEHSQSAFAMGLVLDWARTVGDAELEKLVAKRAKDYYLRDRMGNLAFEPGGQDFLSPLLAEADLMRRVLTKTEFAAWLGHLLPGLPMDGSVALVPAVVTDKSDGKLAHLDGLNLSRAWMLEGILKGLPEGDPRLPGLEATARAHRDAGVNAVGNVHYEGSHWLGSFAVYLVTGRGL